MTEEKQKYEKIFLKVWDNSLLEKDLLMDMCEFYYKTTNGRTFVIEDDGISGTLEIYEEE